MNTNNLSQELRGKRILLISVKLFDYEKFIKQRLEDHGAVVDYFDERPKNTLYAKGIIRLKPSFYKTTITVYFNKLLSTVKGTTYDYVFVIKGEAVPRFFLKRIKEMNPMSELIFYTWDAFSNYRNATTLLDLFDKSFTFDVNDAKKYDLEFRPLFFVNDYKINSLRIKKKYDLLFVGTAHSDRYEISQKIVDFCNRYNLKSHTFYYIQSPIVYFLKLVFDRNFSSVKFRDLSFKSLSKSDIIDLFKKSKAILDIQHPNQRGLTMRTFETLGARCKLMTTNSDIMNYTFFNRNNICVIDRENIQIKLDFFENDFENFAEDTQYAMSIDGWLENIFIKNNELSYWYHN